ncbi:MAG: hypothetical protein EBS89_00175 [Proteobacteria bacterium]|nr:hypothetical protein [Pseudomonadota bacterium]
MVLQIIMRQLMSLQLQELLEHKVRKVIKVCKVPQELLVLKAHKVYKVLQVQLEAARLQSEMNLLAMVLQLHLLYQ